MSDLTFQSALPPAMQRASSAALDYLEQNGGADYVCIGAEPSVIAGVELLNPINPGHVGVSLWDGDPRAGDARLVATYGKWPGDLLDNFAYGGTSDVRRDYAGDLPSRFAELYCEPLRPGGLRELERVVATTGDYQFDTPNCATFGTQAFEAATLQCLFGDSTEPTLAGDVGSPNAVAARIRELNAELADAPYIRSPMWLTHEREAASFEPSALGIGGTLASGSETYGIDNAAGDSAYLRVAGPSGSWSPAYAELDLGSACFGLVGALDEGRVGFEACVGLCDGVAGLSFEPVIESDWLDDASSYVGDLWGSVTDYFDF